MELLSMLNPNKQVLLHVYQMHLTIRNTFGNISIVDVFGQNVLTKYIVEKSVLEKLIISWMHPYLDRSCWNL